MQLLFSSCLKVLTRAVGIPGDFITAVGTHIVKDADLTVVPPHDDDRGVTHGQIFHKIVSGIRNPLDAANIEPGGFEDPLTFLFEVVSRNIRIDRKRSCFQTKLSVPRISTRCKENS